MKDNSYYYKSELCIAEEEAKKELGEKFYKLSKKEQEEEIYLRFLANTLVGIYLSDTTNSKKQGKKKL